MAEALSFHDGEAITVDTRPIVIVRDYLSLMQGGKRIGTLSAEFDFSDIPPELHELVLVTVKGSRGTISLPAGSVPIPSFPGGFDG